jgi:hypothetical protein
MLRECLREQRANENTKIQAILYENECLHRTHSFLCMHARACRKRRRARRPSVRVTGAECHMQEL